MPSNFRWKTHSRPAKRSSVSVAAIGSSQSGIPEEGTRGLSSGTHRFDAEGDNRRQRRSMWSGLDLEAAVHITEPLAHAEEAQAGSLAHAAGVHPAAEILDLQHRLIRLADQANHRLAAPRVADHVAQALLDDVE